MRNHSMCAFTFAVVAAFGLPSHTYAGDRENSTTSDERARLEKIDPPLKDDVLGNAIVGGAASGAYKGVAQGAAAGAAAAATGTASRIVTGGAGQAYKERGGKDK